MKKLLSLLLCLAMVATLCVTAIGEASEGEENIKVCLCVAESLGDKGFYDSAYEGLEALSEDYGAAISTIECKGDSSMYQVAIVEAAENNDIVVAAGWQFWDCLEQSAAELPDTKFIFVDNGLADIENLHSITYAENEGGFLVGYIAMKMSANAKVGVVGGEDSDTINNFIVGYKQGALYANPEGTVLDPVYAGGDYDSPDKGKEYALSLYGQGADVVFAVAGKTGLGVFEAAREQSKYAIGVDSDQKYIDPDVIICSMVKNVGGSIYDCVAAYMEDGVFDGGAIWDADLGSGMVDVGYGDETMAQQVSDELKAEVEALKEKIISGEIVVEGTR